MLRCPPEIFGAVGGCNGKRNVNYARPVTTGQPLEVQNLAAHYQGTCLIQPIQMASESARARITAQLSSDRAGDGFVGLLVRFGSSGICDSPMLLNVWRKNKKPALR